MTIRDTLDPAGALARAIESLGDGYLVAITGAGISLASGIPTFRGTDPDAIWKRDVTELGTRRYFVEDPAGSWSWYTSRFDAVLDKQPNPAHHALAAIERWHGARGGRFLLVSQNVDPLHERAGSRELVKVHGSADRVRCTREGCVYGPPRGSLARARADMAPFHANPSRETVPRCPSCGEWLRQHVLWFDEYYADHDDYQWPRVMDAAATMRLALFVGTSFSVGVTDLFLHGGLRTGIPMFTVDPGAHDTPHPALTVLRVPSEELLPEVCARLAIEPAP